GNDSIYVNVGTVSGSMSVIANNACGSSSATNYLIVVNQPPTTPVITQDMDTLFSSAASGNQWYLDGNILAGETGTNYEPTLTGWYTVSTTNGSGCTTTSSPYYFLYTEIQIVTKSEIAEIYPNPASSNVYISLSGFKSTQARIEIYDILGKLMMSQVIDAGKSPAMITPSLASGIYNLRIFIDDKVIDKQLILE
ncbi:MAG: hypothetical protein CVU05_14870, partial [Bacteroidetes bacterium HGW-Bacteroidetes-21]